MLPAYELAQMRAVQVEAMPDLVTIKRRALTSDGFGGGTTGTPTTVASNVPARITQAQVQAMGGQFGRTLELEKWTVRVPFGTDLKDEDFVIWGAITLQVEDVKDRSWETCISAQAEVVK